MYLKPDQSLYLFHRFSGPVDSTPLAKLYVNGDIIGSPINGSGSDEEWVFNVILPDLDEDDWVEVICEAEISSVLQKAKLIQGIVSNGSAINAQAVWEYETRELTNNITPEDIWDYESRSLSDVDNINYKINIPVASIPVQRGNSLNLYKGTTWSISLKGVGPQASGYYFTVKENEYMNDAESTLQMNKTNVLFLNSVSQSGNINGSITYSADDNGTLNILVKPIVTSKIPSVTKYFWDVKSIDQKVDVISYGRLQLIEDITDRYS